jgi:dTDP-glucose 4,6-dehydratase
MSKRILVTGGAGFIGHHFCEHIIKNMDWEIVVWDKLNYASSGFDRLRDIKVFDDKRVRILTVDMNMPISEGVDKETGEIDYVVNFASESHVDNSIANPLPFIQNNVNLVLNILEWIRKRKIKKMIQVSTDESLGIAPDNFEYSEGSRHNPSNPYAASKGAQEDIVRAYAHTYDLPINIVNMMNVFGERQHPEKFIPSTIRKVLGGEKVIIHADPTKTKPGSRFYIHARNASGAILFVLTKTNEKLDKIDASFGQFNIVGEKEVDNLSLARFMADVLGKPLNYELVDFHSSRPGHDLRYGLSGEKLKALGFAYPKSFEDSLRKTIKWYLGNLHWLDI